MFLVPGQGFQTFTRLIRKTAVTGTGRPWGGGGSRSAPVASLPFFGIFTGRHVPCLPVRGVDTRYCVRPRPEGRERGGRPLFDRAYALSGLEKKGNIQLTEGKMIRYNRDTAS